MPEAYFFKSFKQTGDGLAIFFFSEDSVYQCEKCGACTDDQK